MSQTPRPRQPRGTETGGQFATTERPESGVTLATPPEGGPVTSDSTSDSTSRFPGIAKIPTVGEPISAINFAVGRSYRGDSSMTPELDGVEFTVDAYEFDFDYETGNDLIVMTVTSNGETWETMTPGDSTSTLLA